MKWLVYYEILMELYNVYEFLYKFKCDCLFLNKKFKLVCVCKKSNCWDVLIWMLFNEIF